MVNDDAKEQENSNGDVGVFLWHVCLQEDASQIKIDRQFTVDFLLVYSTMSVPVMPMAACLPTSQMNG